MDERYKETPKLPQEPPSSNTSKAPKDIFTTTLLSSHIEMDSYPATPTPSPTVSPNYKNIPLPPSDTHMVASTRVTSSNYILHTPSPVDYWMPEDEDIQGDMGTTAEHAAFVVAC